MRYHTATEVAGVPVYSSLIHDYEVQLRAVVPLALQPLLQTPAVQPLQYPLFAQHDVQVDVLRCDALHPVISGNKWFKLKYNLLDARRRGMKRLASLGGAWSNHLHALAFCCRQMDIPCTGFVRGDELTPEANPMLRDVAAWGMVLHFLTRADYRDRRFVVSPDTLLIPEGGDNMAGVLGCMTLLPPAQARTYDAVVVPLGTGCTALGLRLALPAEVALWNAPVLKGEDIRQQWLARLQRWAAAPHGPVHWLAAHQGGYGRVNPALLSFIRDIGDNTGLALDPVYSGKAFWALCDQIRQQTVPAGSRVLFVHTGGLQGARGFQSGSS